MSKNNLMFTLLLLVVHMELELELAQLLGES